MKCPQCGKASDVIDSRITATGVRRRRLCLNEHRFTTREVDVTLFEQMERTFTNLRKQVIGLCR